MLDYGAGSISPFNKSELIEKLHFNYRNLNENSVITINWFYLPLGRSHALKKGLTNLISFSLLPKTCN